MTEGLFWVKALFVTAALAVAVIVGIWCMARKDEVRRPR